MHLSRCLCPLKSRVLSTEGLRKLCTSTRLFEPSSQTTQPKIQEDQYDFEDLKVLERTERRKAKIPPFMKDVFMSVYNRDLLAYPEILNKQESADLDGRVKILEDILNNPEMSENDKKNAIKQTRILGAPINLTQGGLALLVTERLRYLETLSANVDLAKQVSDHWVGIGALKAGLPQDEFKNLAPELLYGDSYITLCSSEKIASRILQADIRTKATLQGDNVWYLNGEKVCRDPDGYKLVITTVDEHRIKVLLVRPGASGVTYKEPYVSFDETPAVPVDQAPEAALNLSLTRLDTCVLSYSILKRLIFAIEKYVRGKFVFNNPLADLPLIRVKMAEALLTVYTAESMAYFTAGILDGYEEPDAAMEVAMCRSFVTERCLESALCLLRVPGLDSINQEWTQYITDLRALQVKDETYDTVNLYIALSGLQYAGQGLVDEVKKMRNPLFHPSYIFKKILKDRFQEKDDPKLNLFLEEHLHPSMKPQARKLEYCVLRMRYACEQLLAQHGRNVYLEHTQLQRLAIAATEILAMTAVQARASRAYCIGLRNAEIDMRVSAMFTELSRQRVRNLILDVENGEYLNLDSSRLEFGRKMLDSRSILVEHPTARTFW